MAKEKGAHERERVVLSPRLLRVLFAGAAVLAVVGFFAFFVVSISQGTVVSRNSSQSSATVEDLSGTHRGSETTDIKPLDVTVDPRTFASDMSRVLDEASGDAAINLFDASGGERIVEESKILTVSEKLAAFNDAGFEVGFVVFDLTTKRGLGYNADTLVFSASTVKAPFVAYIAQSLVDTGLASLDDEIEEDVTVSGTGIMATDDETTYDLRTVLYNTIVHSDNTGYALLCENYGGPEFETWVETAGVGAASWEGAEYPYYTPRDLAKLWLDVGAYLVGGEGSSVLCRDMLSQSSNSFIRQVLGTDSKMISKPGFEIDEGMGTMNMAALNDAGIVFDETGPYLIAVMSTADYDDEFYVDNEPLIVDLVAALVDARTQLLVNEEAA